MGEANGVCLQRAVQETGHTQVRHLDRAPETRSVLGYMGQGCRCQIDRLSADQCSSQSSLLGRSQVINSAGSADRRAVR